MSQGCTLACEATSYFLYSYERGVLACPCRNRRPREGVGCGVVDPATRCTTQPTRPTLLAQPRGAPLHSRSIDKNCVSDMKRRPL